MNRREQRALWSLVALPFKIGAHVIKEKEKRKKIEAREKVRAIKAEMRGLKSELKSVEKGIRELRELSAMVQFKEVLDNIADENERLRKETGQ
jgi:hypothetical protein